MLQGNLKMYHVLEMTLHQGNVNLTGRYSPVQDRPHARKQLGSFLEGSSGLRACAGTAPCSRSAPAQAKSGRLLCGTPDCFTAQAMHLRCLYEGDHRRHDMLFKHLSDVTV